MSEEWGYSKDCDDDKVLDEQWGHPIWLKELSNSSSDFRVRNLLSSFVREFNTADCN